MCHQLKRFFFLPLLFFLVGCSSLFSSLRYSTAPYKNETAKLVVPPTLTQPQYNDTYDLEGIIKKDNLPPPYRMSAIDKPISSVRLVVTSGIRLSEDVLGMTVFVPHEINAVKGKTSRFLEDNGFSLSLNSDRSVLETRWKVLCYYNPDVYRFFDDYRWCSRDKYRITFHPASSESGTLVLFSHQEESSTISIALGSRFSNSFKASPSWHSCVGCGRYQTSYIVPRYLSLWGVNSSGINFLMLLGRSSPTKIKAAFPEVMRPFTMVINYPLRKARDITREAIVSSGIKLDREDFDGARFFIKYLDPSLVPQGESTLSRISHFLGGASHQPDISPGTYVVKLVYDPKYKGTRLLVADYATDKEDFSPVALRVMNIIYQNISNNE
ncbi:outer membrane protein assembly factor BamC [Candidatus Ichthyocystis hellenicum]|uniref:outer membrane protein assembly factor BamC n=1 Tax=Candidatus Ichthyocystis hellenicum TaxID=1561003 RepID=UPI000B870D95|nr:outer membrane protein assembly factor BamC [Candidatus Ichthyocystis hellenicum]